MKIGNRYLPTSRHRPVESLSAELKQLSDRRFGGRWGRSERPQNEGISLAEHGPDIGPEMGSKCRFSLGYERSVRAASQSRDAKVISVCHQGLSVDVGSDLCKT